MDRASDVAITGVGVVSSYGVGASPFQRGLLHGQAGPRLRDLSSSPIFAADNEQIFGLGCLEAEALLPRTSLTGVGWEAKLAEAVALLALIDAGTNLEHLLPERIGIAVSAHYSGLQDYAEQFQAGACDPDGMVSATRGPRIGFNATAGYAGIALKAEGPNVTLLNGSVGGIDALIYARNALSGGGVDAMIVCAVDVVPAVLAPVLQERRGTFPPRPFDTRRNGPTLGDGACALLLERAVDASNDRRRRVVPIRSAVTIMADDLQDACTEALRGSLSEAACTPGDIRACFAGGNGSRAGDHAEATAISRVLADEPPAICAIRGGIGHWPAAGSLAQIGAGVLSMRKLRIPPTPGLRTLDPEFQIRVNSEATFVRRGAAIVSCWDADGLAGAVVLGP